MEFRRAVVSDINRIMDIIKQAQAYLKSKELISGRTIIRILK